MANVSVEEKVEQQNALQERIEMQFIVADEWQGECCAPPAAPPAPKSEPDDEQDWDARRCVA